MKSLQEVLNESDSFKNNILKKISNIVKGTPIVSYNDWNRKFPKYIEVKDKLIKAFGKENISTVSTTGDEVYHKITIPNKGVVLISSSYLADKPDLEVEGEDPDRMKIALGFEDNTPSTSKPRLTGGRYN